MSFASTLLSAEIDVRGCREYAPVPKKFGADEMGGLQLSRDSDLANKLDGTSTGLALPVKLSQSKGDLALTEEDAR
jgi:hypothetical protein